MEGEQFPGGSWSTDPNNLTPQPGLPPSQPSEGDLHLDPISGRMNIFENGRWRPYDPANPSGTSGGGRTTPYKAPGGGDLAAGGTPSYGGGSLFATGGIIKEPTLLTGLTSGLRGIMAERGPEAIVPMGQMGSTINISTMVVREEADIHKVARELYILTQRSNKAVGV